LQSFLGMAVFVSSFGIPEQNHPQTIPDFIFGRIPIVGRKYIIGNVIFFADIAGRAVSHICGISINKNLTVRKDSSLLSGIVLFKGLHHFLCGSIASPSVHSPAATYDVIHITVIPISSIVTVAD